MEANKLENQNVRFYLKAPPNSPIWGSTDDMVKWLENWHARGQPVMPKEKAIEILEREDQARYIGNFRYRENVKRRKEAVEE